MSITFHPAPEPAPLEWETYCGAAEAVLPELNRPTYDEASAAADEHSKKCIDCDMYRPLTRPVLFWPELNVANANAGALLSELDLFGWAGKVDADLFLERIAQARRSTDDRGTAPEPVPGTGGRVTYTGREPGYFAGRFDELEKVGVYAKENGLAVAWA